MANRKWIFRQFSWCIGIIDFGILLEIQEIRLAHIWSQANCLFMVIFQELWADFEAAELIETDS